MRFIGVLLFAAGLLQAGPAADLAGRIAESGLNPEECYRVRDLTLSKEDVRFYLTDGYLIFGKAVGDSPVSAVFVASVQGGDAEVLALPPTKSERQSLASFTGSPNLSEHFQVAAFLFTDQTYRDLMAQIGDNASNKKSPEMGLTLAPEWNPVIRNLIESFESRLVLDLLSGRVVSQAFFFATVRGTRLGKFDIIHDSRSVQQITIGQTAYRENVVFFDVWTSFESRSVRNGSRPKPVPELTLNDFRIDATLAPPDLGLQVVTRVKAKVSSSAGAIPFEVSRRMQVTSATIDGQPAEVFERESLRSNLIRDYGNYLFLVIPSKPLAPGREYEVEFKHEGAVVVDVGNKVYAIGSRASWYPNRGMQFANFDVTFRYPKVLDLVSSGEIVSDATEGDLRITRRKTTAPVRLLGFNLGTYERVKITRGKQTVEVCANQTLERALLPPPRQPLQAPAPPPILTPGRGGRNNLPSLMEFPQELPPPSPTARLQEMAGDIVSALEFMSARFGPPPLPTVTVSPAPGAGGQGFPGMIYLSTLSYLGRNDRPIARLVERQKLFFSDILYGHEVAHQWWGNVVSSAGYQHDWLLEALADYSGLLYLEKHKGVRAAESVLNEYRGDLLAKQEDGSTLESAGPIALGLRLRSSKAPDAWRVIAYEKGSWILHMMRGVMGDERFLSFLGELRRRFEWKALDMEGFRQVAAEFMPPKSPDPKLESFFDQWVYSTGIPTLSVKYSLSGKAPAQKLTVTVEQKGVDEDFSVNVPVEIQFGRLKPVVHMVRTGSEPATFTIAARQAPTKVAIDPANTVLAVKK